MIRKSVQRFSLATNAERVCAEIMLQQKDRAGSQFEEKQSRSRLAGIRDSLEGYEHEASPRAFRSDGFNDFRCDGPPRRALPRSDLRSKISGLPSGIRRLHALL